MAAVGLAVCTTGLNSCKTHKAMSGVKNTYRAEGYTLVWADEFTKGGAPDTSNWNYEKGFVRNEELQWYQQENASCKKGLLVIEGRKESKPNPLYEAGKVGWKLLLSAIRRF